MMAKEKDSVQKDMQQDMNLTCQTSPEFLLSRGVIDSFAIDPITSLGRSCSAVAPSFEPQVPFGPQVPEREVEVDMLQDDLGLQVLPAKKRTLSELDNELESHREARGLHPYSTRLPGVDGQLTNEARGVAETQLGRGGILVGPGVPGMVQNSHFGSTGQGRPGDPPQSFRRL